jgi:hypothetical protein
MRASKLITLSAAAVLAGTNVALAASSQSGNPAQGSMTQGKAQHKAQQGPRTPHAGHQQISYRTATPHAQNTRGGAYAQANPRELGEAGYGTSRFWNTQERMRLREIMHDIPRLSYIGNTDIRIDGFVPRTVRQAAVPLPPAVQRMRPRFKRAIGFRYRDQVVILNPATARIVAIVKTPA